MMQIPSHVYLMLGLTFIEIERRDRQTKRKKDIRQQQSIQYISVRLKSIMADLLPVFVRLKKAKNLTFFDTI